MNSVLLLINFASSSYEVSITFVVCLLLLGLQFLLYYNIHYHSTKWCPIWSLSAKKHCGVRSFFTRIEIVCSVPQKNSSLVMLVSFKWFGHCIGVLAWLKNKERVKKNKLMFRLIAALCCWWAILVVSWLGQHLERYTVTLAPSWVMFANTAIRASILCLCHPYTQPFISDKDMYTLQDGGGYLEGVTIWHSKTLFCLLHPTPPGVLCHWCGWTTVNLHRHLWHSPEEQQRTAGDH